MSASASSSRDPITTLRQEAQPGALPGGGGGEHPGLSSAQPPRSPPGRLGLLTAGPEAPPPPPLTSARGRGGGHGSAGVRAAQGRRFWPFRSLQALGRGATRAEQTGSTSRGGRPLCYVIKLRPSSCGPAGFPRLPCFSPASFRFRRGRLRAFSPSRGARLGPPLCLRPTN